jgi:hypothetical protein
VTGAGPLGNLSSGIFFSDGVSGNTVGGTGGGNVIAFNSLQGVFVSSGTGNAILSNSIFSNGVPENRLGIDLVVQIQDQDGVLERGDSVAILTGMLFDGTVIEGRDRICITQ